MDSILTTLYEHFYLMPKKNAEEARIIASHQILKQRLSSRNHKLVLRIMDDKDLICSEVSLDSFIQGFQLAWRIVNQIQNYDGHSDYGQKAESDACHVFSKEVSK